MTGVYSRLDALARSAQHQPWQPALVAPVVKILQPGVPQCTSWVPLPAPPVLFWEGLQITAFRVPFYQKSSAWCTSGMRTAQATPENLCFVATACRSPCEFRPCTCLALQALLSMTLDNRNEILRQERQKISVRSLYALCAVGVLLLVFYNLWDYVTHHTMRVPPRLGLHHVLSWALVAMCFVAVLVVRCSRTVRPFAEVILGIIYTLLVFTTALCFDMARAHFKEHLLMQFPYLNGSMPVSHVGSPPPPVPGSAYLTTVVGMAPADYVDGMVMFIAMLGISLSSLFVVHVRFLTTALCSAFVWVMFVLWPLVFQQSPFWFSRIFTSTAWLFIVWFSSYTSDKHLMEQVDLMHRTQAMERQKAEQRAYSVLNHILKNIMADAMGCIEMFCAQQSPAGDETLSMGVDLLFRGMWWCKIREAITKIVAGSYKVANVPTNLDAFLRDLVRGRNVCALPCEGDVMLDPVVINVILDNAIANALRHGCPEDPAVTLSVDLPREVGSPSSRAAWCNGAPPNTLLFRLRNRANPAKGIELLRWSSRDQKGFVKDGRDLLSDGLGLEHIALVANTCDLTAELWQEEDHVVFELSVQLGVESSPIAVPEATTSPAVVPPFPDGICIMCMDDSPVARSSLDLLIRAQLPTADVRVFGGRLTDGHEFPTLALEQADIVILDQVSFCAPRLSRVQPVVLCCVLICLHLVLGDCA